MNIRTATYKDIEQLAQPKNPQIQRHLDMFRQNQQDRLKEMDEGSVIYLLVEENDEILAHVLLKLKGIETEPGYPNINDLYVKKERRGERIGTRLISEIEKLTKEKGFNKISLAVNPTLNPKAKKLYERLGYKQTKTPTYLDGIYEGDEDWVIDMVKEL